MKHIHLQQFKKVCLNYLCNLRYCKVLLVNWNTGSFMKNHIWYIKVQIESIKYKVWCIALNFMIITSLHNRTHIQLNTPAIEKTINKRTRLWKWLSIWYGLQQRLQLNSCLWFWSPLYAAVYGCEVVLCWPLRKAETCSFCWQGWVGRCQLWASISLQDRKRE